MKQTFKNTNVMVKAALLVAFAVVLMYLDFPIFPGFSWLKIDFSEVPILIGAFAFGPLAGVVMEALKNILILLVKGTTSVGIGELANFIIGVAIVLPAAIIYKKNKTKKSALVSLTVGTIVMTVVGTLANYYIFVPMYSAFLPDLKQSTYVVKYITFGVIPFNLIKGILVSAITMVVYKKVARLIHREAAMLDNKKAS